MKTASPLTLFSAAIALLITLTPAFTQEQIYRFDGTNPSDQLGRSIDAGADVNGDGYSDIISGAPYAGPNGNSYAGEAIVFSGVDGSVLYRKYGNSASDEFGHSVCFVGDVNLDGFDDFAVGARYADVNGSNSGSVYLYSGIDGTLIVQKNGDSSNHHFGTSIAGGQDINNDGYPDWLVGAPEDSYGSVRAFSGKTNASLYKHSATSTGDDFGRYVAMVGDTNGDGYMDFAVADPFADYNSTNSGRVSVHDGNGGSILFNVDGTHDDQLGREHGVDGLGDVNGDGLADIVIGNVYDDDGGSNHGKVMVVSGLDGSIIYEVVGDYGNYLGFSVSSVGDIDGDGLDDWIAGRQDQSSVDLHSGSNGLLLHRFEKTGHFGWTLSGAGDVNGDGLGDIAICDPYYDGFNNDAGAVFVISSRDFSGDWPSLPTVFEPVNHFFFDDFDIRQGVLPNHYATSFTDASTFERDPEAWCNVGNFDACRLSYSGSFALEMGMNPSSNNYHEVFNAMTIGLDGQGSGGHLLSFWAYNCGENSQAGDGVFVSEDGVNWAQAFPGWSQLPVGQWTYVEDVNLSNLGVSTQGTFYLRFSEQDNFPFFYSEGVAIDDITVKPSITMTADNFSGGGYGIITTEGCTPDRQVVLAISFAGPGPIQTAWGTVFLAHPIRQYPTISDANGQAQWVKRINGGLSGTSLWIQSLDVIKGVLSNPVSVTIN
jgi:hypothetical protein